jgi:hypothetical protein
MLLETFTEMERTGVTAERAAAETSTAAAVGTSAPAGAVKPSAAASPLTSKK